MPPCSEKVNGQACVGIAGPSGRCAVHAAGYLQVGFGMELRCVKCRRLLAAGEWCVRSGENVQHSKDCREHPDTAKERAAAVQAK